MTDAVPNPDEPQPKSDEFSLTFEREVMRNWGFRTTAVYARNFNLRRLEELYRPYDIYNIAITRPDPGPDGLVGSTDDPNKTMTYWEYPAALSGRQFAGTKLVGWPGQQTLQDDRTGRHQADVRRAGRPMSRSRSRRPILCSTTGSH